jgi:hypothetical protein
MSDVGPSSVLHCTHGACTAEHVALVCVKGKAP